MIPGGTSLPQLLLPHPDSIENNRRNRGVAARTLNPFRSLLISGAGWMNQQQQHAIECLREENRVLRVQLGVVGTSRLADYFRLIFGASAAAERAKDAHAVPAAEINCSCP